MTPAEITALLTRRNKLVTRRDGLIDWNVIRHIDAQLAEVAPGTDNRIDLALGRRCAVLPERAKYNVNSAVTLDSIGFSEEHQYLICECGYHATGLIDGLAHQSECQFKSELEMTRRIWKTTPPEPY